MFKDLSRKTVLSGNSALFLAEIEEVTKKTKYAIGYREHKRENRYTRNFALKHFLDNKESLIEPKNVIFSEYYNRLGENYKISAEMMSNIVIAKAYKDFLDEYNIF